LLWHCTVTIVLLCVVLRIIASEVSYILHQFCAGNRQIKQI